MGDYYARAQGEPEAVATAIREHYWPRFAGDRIATTATGRALAIADRADTLCGIFATGRRPSGDKDPFALRRAALGLLRTLIEGNVDLNLFALLEEAARQQPIGEPKEVIDALWAFIMDRLRGYYHELGESPGAIAAVAAVAPPSPLDFDRRLAAVRTFVPRAECQTLAAAHKRCKNILRKTDEGAPGEATVELLTEPAEKALFDALNETRPVVASALEKADYERALETLARLRIPVDKFFDEVMVMADDVSLRRNRLALLAMLVSEFQCVADLSFLQAAP